MSEKEYPTEGNLNDGVDGTGKSMTVVEEVAEGPMEGVWEEETRDHEEG